MTYEQEKPSYGQPKETNDEFNNDIFEISESQTEQESTHNSTQ